MSDNTEQQPIADELNDEQIELRLCSDREKLYFAAKDGLSLVVYQILDSIDTEEARNAIVNEVCIENCFVN